MRTDQVMLSNKNTNTCCVVSSSSSDPFLSSSENGVTTTNTSTQKRKRRPAGTPDPDAEVVSLSPRTLLESDRYICEICNQGFQRDQNLQMHRRRHKVPWKLLKRDNNIEVKKRVYVCPEPTCLHHNPCHALGDLVGIKKHFRRKHSNHKQWVCERCSKGYAVQSDYKAHLKTCGTRGHSCDCGRVFSRVESFIEHQDNCSARRVHREPPRPPQTAVTVPACSSRTASTVSTPSSETNYGGTVAVTTPQPLEGRPIHQRISSSILTNSSNNLNLELQLLPLSSNQNPNQENQQQKVKEPSHHHNPWVELRLLLNEQALAEKLENHDMPLTDAIRSSCPTSEKPDASENEKNFIQILLTRLLVRPDAVPLFSEVVHLFGRSVEDSMLKQAEWFLAGQDVLFGRKTIRQKLIIVGESKGLPTKPQFWKPWGWCNSSSSDHITANKAGKKRKFEITSIEEGEVIEEGSGSRKVLLPRVLDENSPSVGYGITTERAFVQLVLPCIDQSSDESRSTFVNELVRQFSNIEQQLSSVTNRSTTSNKQMGTASSGSEISSNKGSTRKGLRGGSPSLARRSSANTTDTSPPPSPAALRASMSLRLQFLLRLLPVICGEPSFKNTRHALASTIVRLLGSRVVYEDYAVCSPRSELSKAETESTIDPSSMADLSSEVLFDRLLFVLHGLLSNHQPKWLKPRPSSNESSKDFTLFDRDAAESLQNELSRMQLPDTIRWRIQAAMPILLPSLRCSLSCQPHSVPPTALTLVQPSGSTAAAGTNQRNSPAISKSGTAAAQGKLKPTMLAPHQQQEADNTDVVDPWTLLEDGTSSGLSSSNASNSSDMANLRATCWLKGAVRVRRTDLTYVGSVDDDS